MIIERFTITFMANGKMMSDSSISFLEKKKKKKKVQLHIDENTVEPLLTDTSIIRTPLYYGQFTWSPRDRNPYKAYLSKTDTSITRTLIPVPLVSVIKRFDCTQF